MPFLTNSHTFLLSQKKSSYLVVKTLFFLLIFPVLIEAQQPSYQVVGVDFLEGKDIYSLLEGATKELWIGTDEGLILELLNYNLQKPNYCPNRRFKQLLQE